jgi:CDP-glucose 4,6-dehydratase
MSRSAFDGLRVFLTGHTGFKGGWLSLLLSELGARVHGYSLAAPTEPSFFSVCRLRSRLASHTEGDINDYDRLLHALRQSKAELVFHLAAQPLVRRSYREPIYTVMTNVMGTAHILQAASEVGGVRALLNVTSDKCYENQERSAPYAEHEPMGGYDPYSASKGCAELLTSAWRRSFLAGRGTRVATARAGNVIGGGDWAEDRLVPDFLRALDAGRALKLRSPASTRPWQHVLEPIAGYMRLASRLMGPDGEQYAEGWNFGPSPGDVRTVQWMVERLCESSPGSAVEFEKQDSGAHECALLGLDSAKARQRLQWTATWDPGEAIRQTLSWHQAWRAGRDMQAFSLIQTTEHGCLQTMAS